MTQNKYRTYKIEGTAVDQDWIVKNRTMIEEYSRDDMRAHGFVPVLDIPTALTWSWDEPKNVFNYTLTCAGQYMGKRKAKLYVGILHEQGIRITVDGKTVEINELLSS